MTQQEVREKVIKLGLSGNLVMNRGKCIIPIPDTLSDYHLARLYVLHNLRKEKITPEQSKGYKASISVNNARKILYESLPLSTEGYCNLESIDQLRKSAEKEKTQYLDFFLPDINLDDAFKIFMRRRYEDYTYNDFKAKLKDFFKYMPQLGYIFNKYIHSDLWLDSIGYCCEDCSGPVEFYHKLKFENAIKEISLDLKKIKH